MTSDAARPPAPKLLALVQRPEGELADADRAVLSVAGKLAAELGGAAWAALCFGAAGDPESFAAYQVPEVLEVLGADGLESFPLAQAEAVANACRSDGFSVVVVDHNDLGSFLAPALAARLAGALLTELISFEAAEDGLVLYRRALGAHVVEGRVWRGDSPLVLSLDPRAASSVVLPSMEPSRPVVRRVDAPAGEGGREARVLERIPPDPQTVDVSEAEVIFCAGKGFSPESFEQFRELARLLNASLGVTRPVYDLGWAGFERMIGQTGKTVAPRFYLGMGISGSMHHVGGIKDSKRLVSLNVDAKAPMFPNSDEGFVGDVREVLPLLLAKVRARMGEETTP